MGMSLGPRGIYASSNSASNFVLYAPSVGVMLRSLYGYNEAMWKFDRVQIRFSGTILNCLSYMATEEKRTNILVVYRRMKNRKLVIDRLDNFNRVRGEAPRIIAAGIFDDLGDAVYNRQFHTSDVRDVIRASCREPAINT